MGSTEELPWKEIRFTGRDMKEAAERFHDWLRIAAAEEIEDEESIQVHHLHITDGFGLVVRYKSTRQKGWERKMQSGNIFDRETANSFKCSRCGNMYDTLGKSELPCPVCGNVCTVDTCTVIPASTEDY